MNTIVANPKGGFTVTVFGETLEGSFFDIARDYVISCQIAIDVIHEQRSTEGLVSNFQLHVYEQALVALWTTLPKAQVDFYYGGLIQDLSALISYFVDGDLDQFEANLEASGADKSSPLKLLTESLPTLEEVCGSFTEAPEEAVYLDDATKGSNPGWEDADEDEDEDEDSENRRRAWEDAKAAIGN